MLEDRLHLSSKSQVLNAFTPALFKINVKCLLKSIDLLGNLFVKFDAWWCHLQIVIYVQASGCTNPRDPKGWKDGKDPWKDAHVKIWNARAINAKQASVTGDEHGDIEAQWCTNAAKPDGGREFTTPHPKIFLLLLASLLLLVRHLLLVAWHLLQVARSAMSKVRSWTPTGANKRTMHGPGTARRSGCMGRACWEHLNKKTSLEQGLCHICKVRRLMKSLENCVWLWIAESQELSLGVFSSKG